MPGASAGAKEQELKEKRARKEVMKIAAATTVAFALFAAIARATARTATEAQAPVAPRFLTETGLYADAGDVENRLAQSPLLAAVSAVERRRDETALGAVARRVDRSTWRSCSKWELPVGTKFWKEFSFNGRKVETRFLWQTGKDHWVFATYVWNEQQTDAELAPETASPTSPRSRTASGTAFRR